MTLKKIKLIDEVISGLEKDSTASTLIENMARVCYALTQDIETGYSSIKLCTFFSSMKEMDIINIYVH